MRRATPADRPAIEAFLGARAERAMFPLSNLLAHGMEGGHPRAMRFWLAGNPLEGVLGLSEEGMAFPVLSPSGAAEAAAVLRGGRIMGFAGEAEAAGRLRAALGLGAAPARLDHAEPHYLLDLDRLRMPPVAGLSLGPLARAPRALMAEWAAAYEMEALGSTPDAAAYEMEALGSTPDAAAAEAEADLDAWVASDSHRVLWRDGRPVARTGFNAHAPGIVQVGGVYVPPSLRGRGLARAAVALHLREARAAGARRSTLFAATEAASRAYAALGFERIGAFLLCLLHEPRVAA